MAYFVGMVGNTLPLPGGIGGVDGGMIGAFTAFGVPVQLAVVAVLAYRGFAFWLPTLPGAVAYLQLRRTVARWQRSPLPARPTGPGAASTLYFLKLWNSASRTRSSSAAGRPATPPRSTWLGPTSTRS